MASLFTHAVVGAAIGHAGKPAWHIDRRFWPVVIACSILPDIDSLGFRLGVPYGALWGHRGMTHSLLFAFIVAIFAAMVLDGRFHWQWGHRGMTHSLLFAFIVAIFAAMVLDGRFHWQGRLVIVFFLVMASHGVLDAMTNGGLGVAFFSPFNTERYFFPWRPILVSPIGPGRFFGARGLRIIGNEILWVWCPTLVLFVLIKLLQYRRSPIPTSDTALGNNQD